MGHKILLLTAFFAFVLAMPLCASGMVTHPCDPCAAEVKVEQVIGIIKRDYCP